MVWEKGGDYRENSLKADKYDKLAQATQGIVNVFSDLSKQTGELNAVKDESLTGDALSRAVSVVFNLPPLADHYTSPNAPNGH